MTPLIIFDLIDGNFILWVFERTGMTNVSEGSGLLAGVGPLQELNQGRVIDFHIKEGRGGRSACNSDISDS